MLRDGKMQSVKVCLDRPYLAVPTVLPCITTDTDLRPQGCAWTQLRFLPAADPAGHAALQPAAVEPR